jgi:hypothetical protein
LIDDSNVSALKKSMLILELAVNLLQHNDLNDEDTSILASLMEHSVVQASLSKKLVSTKSDMTASRPLPD